MYVMYIALLDYVYGVVRALHCLPVRARCAIYTSRNIPPPAAAAAAAVMLPKNPGIRLDHRLRNASVEILRV